MHVNIDGFPAKQEGKIHDNGSVYQEFNTRNKEK